MLKAYHFVGKTLRDGSPIPKDGKWLEVAGPIEICKRGLHASLHVADALKYAPGTTLCLVNLDGEHQDQDDKVCYQRRRIVARFDATELLRADARASALSVIHLWKAPQVVIDYLTTGDETKRIEARRAAAAYYYAAAAAADAAYYAAAAADAASYYYAAAAADAASYAYAADARKASREKSRARLQAAVDAKFKELLS